MTEESKKNIADDEIDLIVLAKTIWEGRRTIILSVLICMFIGLAVALLSPKEYTASATLVPQISDNSSKIGGLSSLAAMAGFNLDMVKGSSELSPVVYPQILSSIPFQMEILNTQFIFPEVQEPVSIFQYYNEIRKPGLLDFVKKITLGLLKNIVKALKPSPVLESNENIHLLTLTKEQNEIRKFIEESISLEVNDKEGYLTLSYRSEDAVLSAQVAEKAQQLLQQYITEFKIEKASAQLEFIEERYTENKKEFEKAQEALAAFRDRNKNVTSARARTQEERLQSEYQLAFDVYSELAQQMEQARIQVKEETPVFSIIKPVTVPIEKSRPNRPMILIIWTFLGGIIGIGWIFGKQFLAAVKERWNEESS